jgi:hypothetical protein
MPGVRASFSPYRISGKDGSPVKKLIALLLVAGALITAVGCGGTPTTKPAGAGTGGGTGAAKP